MASEQPKDAPPSYQESQATGTSTASQPSRPTHLEIPQAINGIPAAQRKSMEDEIRPLPEGWVRSFDPNEQHQFFVDTRADPPRSIWTHPYDDEQYLSSLSSEERERIQEEEAKMRRPVTPGSVDEKSAFKDSSPSHETYPDLPARPGRAASTDAGRKKSLGERLKEKATGMTKEEREVEKQKRAEEERRYAEMHARYRAAMVEASRTGQPVFFTKDRDGRDVYVEPPQAGYGGYGGGYGYGQGGYGVSPYAPGSPYSNSRFIRPANPYNRGYGGYGYGPGFGRPGLGLPIAGGLLGGALLGAALF